MTDAARRRTRSKLVAMALIAGGATLFLGVFIWVGGSIHGGAHAISGTILVNRSLGACAFVMLHLVLIVGPLARLNGGFMAMIYHRRQLGVATFAIAACHGVLSLLWQYGAGTINPLVALFAANPNYNRLYGFPFESLGAAALVLLLVLASTSHDFWLRVLTPPVWKAIHMLAYLAYALLVGHVLLGALQAERAEIYPVLLIGGAVAVAGLHLTAAALGRRRRRPPVGDDWVDAGPAADIPDGGARSVEMPDGERAAVFRFAGDRIVAISDLCPHSNGPLADGKVIDGCIVCPWHGLALDPETGKAVEGRLRTRVYQTRVIAGHVRINPRKFAKGAPQTPSIASETLSG